MGLLFFLQIIWGLQIIYDIVYLKQHLKLGFEYKLYKTYFRIEKITEIRSHLLKVFNIFYGSGTFAYNLNKQCLIWSLGGIHTTQYYIQYTYTK